jgi:hypothetical protein
MGISPTTARRALCLILALIVALLIGPLPANAQSPDITPPDPTSGADPLTPSSDYPVDLDEQIAAFQQKVTAWQQQGQALATQAQSLESRIQAHNAVVDSYPNREAPPEVAGPVNAEAAALNAERDGLNGQIGAWKGQSSALEAERLQLLQRMAYVLQNQYKVVPKLPFRKAPGGDSASPTGRNRLGEYSRGNGGDAPSRQKENAALDAYARDNGVPVVKNQIRAELTPETYDKLSPDDAAKLREYRKFDGLVRKPDGHYKALEVKTGTAKYQPGQQPFDNAIRAGGQATARLDGQEIIIDEVEIVPG